MDALEFQDATVVDGSGDAAFDAHVLVADGHVARVGETPAGADRTVDASGLHLAPGFVDMHAHSELRLLDRPEATEKVTQGVTLEVMGQDGVSVAPVPDEHRDEWGRRVQSLLGTRESWEWTGVGEFLDALAAADPAVNCAYYAPHGNLRSTAVGFEDRELAEEELAAVRAALEDALDEGAFAMSKGMIYPPSSHGRDEEFVALAETLGERDGFMVSHVWNETDRVVESIDRYVRVCERGGCQPHVSHLKVAGERNWGRADEVLAVFDEAEERGTRVTFDQYPYTAGSTMLTALLPPWARAGTRDEVRDRLADDEVRERIRDDIENGIEGWENLAAAAGTWENVLVTRSASGRAAGETIADLADERGTTPVEAMCDLLVEEDLDVTMADFVMSEKDIEPFLADPHGTVCTDGIFGGKPHPRAVGTYPRVLERYVRERGVLSLERAIYKMAGHPADVLGLPERGRVREGYVADLVAFDLDAVAANATYEDPMQLADGIEYVLVGGMPAVWEGEQTDERPGEVLRSTERWDGPARPDLTER
jgi:N-acyl-D-amino-acid deacylase